MTRLVFVLGVVLLVASAPAVALMPRVRALDASLLDLLIAGYQASPTIRDLVDRLDRSDVIVHLERLTSPAPGIGGTLRFVGRAGGFRYVRIAIDTSRKPHALALLAHELQHALEVAGDPHAVDEASFEALYRRIGRLCRRRTTRVEFDTAAAQAVTQQVLDEVSGRTTAGVDGGRRVAAARPGTGHRTRRRDATRGMCRSTAEQSASRAGVRGFGRRAADCRAPAGGFRCCRSAPAPGRHPASRQRRPAGDDARVWRTASPRGG